MRRTQDSRPLTEVPINQRHDFSWKYAAEVVFSELLVPAWRAVEEAARAGHVPFAAQAQQVRERAAAAARQLHKLLGMAVYEEADAAAAAAASRAVSLPWFGSQLAAGMRHAADIASGTQQAQQAQQDCEMLQLTQQQALPWVWRLAEAVCECVAVAATALLPWRGSPSRPGGGASTGGSGSSSSCGSLLAVRAAYLIGQLRRVSEAFVAVLPTLEGQHEAVADGPHAAFQLFCFNALPAAADRLPATGAAQLSGLVAAASRATEAAGRSSARCLQHSAPAEFTIDLMVEGLQPVAAVATLHSGTRALCALQTAATAAAASEAAAGRDSSVAGAVVPEAAAAALEAQMALLSLARSLTKLVLATLHEYPRSGAVLQQPHVVRLCPTSRSQDASQALARTLCMLALGCEAVGGVDKLSKHARCVCWLVAARLNKLGGQPG